MVELTAKTPFAGLLPLNLGTVTLTEPELGPLTVLTPLGDAKAFSEALKAAHGMAAPGPNRMTGKAGARALWFGRGQILLAGPAADPGLAAHATLVDVSDGWAAVELQGAGAADVLARLVPVDLREGAFKRGHCLRSQLQHMPVSIARLGPEKFLLMVFRSMAGSLVHDLKPAMAAVAARG